MADMMVTVVMLTYNHEKYVSQAIDSVLKQKVNFNYEILVGDDCSRDCTRKILLGYKEKYPQKFHLVFNKVRKGPVGNSKGLINKIKGTYVACLEGDDFWCDENKLQKQVDFLETHKTASGVFHDAYIIGNQVNIMQVHKKSITSAKDYLNYMPHIPTCSLVYRTKCINGMDDFCETYYIGDRIIHALLLRYGQLHYLDEKMSVYRHITHNSQSFSSQRDEILCLEWITAMRMQRKIWNHRYDKLIHEKICDAQKGFMEASFWQGDLYGMLKFWLQNLTVCEKWEAVHRLTRQILRRKQG